MRESTLHWSELTPVSDGRVGLAVLGFPVTHSISPQLHQAALKELEKKNPSFRNWFYEKIEVPPSDLANALKRLSGLGYRGLNLTVPHKVEALDLVGWIDHEARAFGAVNTLLLDNGVWKGFNTDGAGLSASIRREFGRGMEEFEVLVLGAGGAARAAIAQGLRDGCSAMTIRNRSSQRTEELIASLRRNGFDQRLVALSDGETCPQSRSSKDLLVINATSLGLKAADPSPFDLSDLPPSTCVYDMIYNPSETPLLRQAASLGMSVANGLGMLVGQAVRSLEIWTREEVSSPVMEKAALRALLVEPA